MNYIILDLEWKQEKKKLNLSLEGEIIQIGAVKLDQNFKKMDTFKIVISPKYYKKLHRKVAALTQLSQEDLTYGFAFPIAIRHFKNWCGDAFLFLTWGNDDLRILKSNLTLHKLDTNWIPASYDLQRIFDEQIAHENRRCSLLYAMELIGKKPLQAHDALHDAQNTYEISKLLDLQKAFEEYSTYIWKPSVATNSDMVNQMTDVAAYPNKKAAFSASFGKEIPCPCCKSPMQPIQWAKQNDIKFISIAKCSCGQEYFVRIRLKHALANTYTASILLYYLNPQLTAYYIEKRLKYLSEIAKAQPSILYLPEYSSVTPSFCQSKELLIQQENLL